LASTYVAVTLWSIHANFLPELSIDQKDGWQQPIAANDLFQEPISIQQWHFDYEATEKILTQVTLASNGELLLNSDLAKILTKAVNSLPENLDDTELKHAAFLVSKNFPDLNPISRKNNVPEAQLSTLLVNYYHLKSAEKNLDELIEKKFTFQDRFIATVTRQNHYLSTDVATQLFGKQRSITHYLLERRAIRLKINQDGGRVNAQ
jgi:hypothetical protein